MKHLKTFFGVLTLVLAVSCAKTQSATSGQVMFVVSSDQQVADVTKSKVSDYTSLPEAADFIITITGEESSWTGKVSEWSTETALHAGEYSVTATYGSLDAEGFDKPFFEGSETFEIKGGEEEPVAVSIPVSLGNAVVKMEFTDWFKNYYPEYTFKLTRDGSDIVTFTKGETRAAFVDPWKFNLEGTLTAETKTNTINKTYSNLEVATAYTFRFDVSNAAGTSITIEFNDTVETVELGDCELND